MIPVQDAESDDAAFDALLAKIARDREFECGSYKVRCLRRRIAVRLRARNVATYEDYAALLDADQREYDRLLDTLTINVTKLFRNWETFAAIERHVVPALWSCPTDAPATCGAPGARPVKRRTRWPFSSTAMRQPQARYAT